MMERAIEHALAHVYSLVRRREKFMTPPAMLRPTADGNTALPLDPVRQYLLLVMNPLYPQLYAAQIVLSGTFTRVDVLPHLPNEKNTHALHIMTRKAPPGFVDALQALHRENWRNLYLGKLEPSPDGVAPHTLQYFPCTGSAIRNPDPNKFEDELVVYFYSEPQPFVIEQEVAGAADVFAALRDLEEQGHRDDMGMAASAPTEPYPPQA